MATADGTTVAFGYDNANRPISEDQTLTGFPLRHISTPVDVDGNRASISLASVYTLLYQYTQRQQMSLISTSAAAYYAFTYDLNGNMTKQQDKFQGLDSTNFTFDALDRVTLCTQTGANDVSFATSHYDYDLNNNIQDTYRDEQAGKGERFGYDFANQLTSAVYNADNVQTPNPINYDRSVSYICDALNRLSLNDNGTVTSYTPNGLNQLTTVTGQQSLYDQNFNQKKINGWVYTYDAARRVTNASNSTTGQSVQFSYDGLNRCVKRVTDGVTTLLTYDGWKPIAEWDTAGTRTAWNMYGPGPDQILMRYRASDLSYLHYHSDQFGSVKFLLNSVNTGVEKYTYDAFGAPKITDWAGVVRTDSAYGNRFMFTGREYLSTIGIYDYRNRMYSPLIGRFLQTDPLGFGAGDNNLYRYVGNNPVNNTDSMGATIALRPGVDGPAYFQAIDYLSQSARFRDIYSIVNNSDTIYTIFQVNQFQSQDTNAFVPPNSIFWDPYAAQLTGLGGQQSPALQLAHEFDHAAFYDVLPGLSELLASNFGLDYLGVNPDDLLWASFGTLEEMRVVLGDEAVIASQLGEPTRNDHEDYGASPVTNPTEGVEPNGFGSSPGGVGPGGALSGGTWGGVYPVGSLLHNLVADQPKSDHFNGRNQWRLQLTFHRARCQPC